MSHPLGYLAEPFEAYTDPCPKGEAFANMLRKISKNFSVQDLVEEYCMCRIFPVRTSWDVKAWAAKESDGIPVLDFTLSFGLEASLVEGDTPEILANSILGKEIPKENRESNKLLGAQRRNRVYEFLKKTTPTRAASCENDAEDANPGEDAVKGTRGGCGGRRRATKRQKMAWFENIDDSAGPRGLKPPLAIEPLRASALEVNKSALVIKAAGPKVTPVRVLTPSMFPTMTLKIAMLTFRLRTRARRNL